MRPQANNQAPIVASLVLLRVSRALHLPGRIFRRQSPIRVADALARLGYTSPAPVDGPPDRGPTEGELTMRYDCPFALRIAGVLAITFTVADAGRHAAAQNPSRVSPREWTAPGGDPASTRYSALSQVTPANIARLGAAWVTPLPEDEVSKASPVIAGGLMFVTTTAGTVLALDAARGTTVWSFKPDTPFNG